MASRTYSSHDLLRMRNISAQMELSGRLQTKLQHDLDLGDIIRVPADRSLPLIEEETREPLEQPVNFRSSRRNLNPQLDGTDSEWRYRGRSDSEHEETQPIDAPTSLAAQKDEGFQRFYKAVVSPTHVRVTAGGRIVPNTRGSSSPTSKWAKEKSNGESGSHPPIRDPPAYSAFPVPPPIFGAIPPMLPGFIPAMPPSMTPGHHPHPFSMMPWPMGFPVGGGFGMPVMSSTQSTSTHPDLKQSKEFPKDGKKGDSEPLESAKGLPISPPDHFDPSRPFLYNGHWMMYPGNQFLPFGLPPFSGFHPPPVLPGQTAPSHSSPGQHTLPNGLPKDVSCASSQHEHGQAAPTVNPPGLSSTYKPPISSIRPSEITKKQIEVLRGSLKYLEDQLQYNKHQIDEKGVESQAQIVRQQIQQFEKNLESQLGFEKTHYPSHEGKNHSSSSEYSQGSKSTTTDEVKADRPGREPSCPPQEDHVRSRKMVHRSVREKSSTRFVNGGNSTRSVSAFPTSAMAFEASTRTEPMKKTNTLPVNAALAPPFQPLSSHMMAGCDRDGRYDAYSSTLGRLGKPMNHFTEETGYITPSFASRLNGSYEKRRASTPYLVGQIPTGSGPGPAKDLEYIYSRELTEDELRARHMYWGMAPGHLQKGLPKFDGKDFYPPSPVKDNSSEFTSSPTLSARHLSIADSKRSYSVSSPKQEPDVFQWFRPVPRSKCHDLGKATQSESHARQESLMSTSSPKSTRRTGSCATQPEPTKVTLRRAAPSVAQNSASPGSKCQSSSDEGDDDKALLFKGRKSMGRAGTKTHNEIWQSVLKRGKSSANVTPGTVSSMTAQGVLPHYAGHATASLTPAIANASSSKVYKNKGPDVGNDEVTHGSIKKKRENLPPSTAL